MPAPHVTGAYGLALPLAMAAAGWAWRDCLLLAAAVTLAYRRFLLRMDRGAPWSPLSAALNTLTAGMSVGAAGLALLAVAGSAWLGWWQPAEPHPGLTLLFVAIGAGSCCIAATPGPSARMEALIWLCMLGGTALVIEAHRSGMADIACIFVVAVGAALLWSGWQLAHTTATDLLRSGGGR